MRVPGLTGSLGAGVGPQESSAMVVSPEGAIVRQPVCCCKFEARRIPKSTHGVQIGRRGVPGEQALSGFFLTFLRTVHLIFLKGFLGGAILAIITTVFW